MKAQDDAPLFLDIPRVAKRQEFAFAATPVVETPVVEPETCALRNLSTACVVPTMPPLAIRISDLRGRHPPIRLADLRGDSLRGDDLRGDDLRRDDLRGDDLRDETSHVRAA